MSSADNIFRSNGRGWTLVPGGLKHISVANDGTVWGVTFTDNIFRRYNDKWAP